MKHWPTLPHALRPEPRSVCHGKGTGSDQDARRLPWKWGWLRTRHSAPVPFAWLWTFLPIVAAMLLAGCGQKPAADVPTGVPESGSNTITVFVPCGMLDPFMKVRRKFESLPDKPVVKIENDNAVVLMRKIRRGDYADILITPGETEMNLMVKEGYIDPGSVRGFGTFRLILVVPAANKADVKTMADLSGPKVKSVAIAEPGGVFALEDFPHNDPPGNHRQIGRQAALAAKMPENREIVLDDREKNLGAEVVQVLVRQADRSCLGRVIDHVNHQAHEGTLERNAAFAGLGEERHPGELALGHPLVEIVAAQGVFEVLHTVDGVLTLPGADEQADLVPLADRLDTVLFHLF